ncbi:MAG: hypothetical protein ACI9XC_000603 [Gammaproteobacteria bacterium]|jgi:hypothetical protein
MNFQSINNWHKILGMVATIFIIVLSITGFLLLHTDDFKLQDKLVANEILLNWYDIKPEQSPISYKVGSKWITIIDDQVYFEKQSLPNYNELFHGAVYWDNFYVLAFENSLDLLTEDGERIERLTNLHGVPQGIENIGIDGEAGIYLKTSNDYFMSDLDLTTWQPTIQREIRWSVHSEAPNSYIDQIMQLYRGSGLPMERIILDLHSGRILGRPGIWIVDIVVIIFLALSFTGWWSWFKRRALQKEIDEEY